MCVEITDVHIDKLKGEGSLNTSSEKSKFYINKRSLLVYLAKFCKDNFNFPVWLTLYGSRSFHHQDISAFSFLNPDLKKKISVSPFQEFHSSLLDQLLLPFYSESTNKIKD